MFASSRGRFRGLATQRSGRISDVADAYDEFAMLLMDAHETQKAQSSSENVQLSTATTISLLEQFCDTAAQRLESLISDAGALHITAEERDQWKRELHTWMLMRDLYRLRIHVQTNMDTEMKFAAEATNELRSDLPLIGPLMSESGPYREHIAVRNWLQAIAPEFQPVGGRRDCWMYTRIKAQRQVSMSSDSDTSVSMLDPDAPTRENRPLEEDDQEFEREFLRTIYAYLRRGDNDKMIKLCHACDQPWRVASFSGNTLYRNANLMDNEAQLSMPGNQAVVGNPRRLLWRIMCRQLAENKNIDTYERAAYGILSGDLASVLAVAEQWEDYLFAYYNEMIEKKLDKPLLEREQRHGTLDQFNYDLSDALTPSEIFDCISRVENPDIRRDATSPFRVVQEFIIKDNPRQLLELIAEQCKHASLETPDMQQYLRFIVHIAIIFVQLRVIQSDDPAIVQLLVHYINLQIAQKKTRTIAAYCSLLPGEKRASCYASFLKTLNVSRKDAEEYLRQASQYGMDVNAICLNVVDTIMEEENAAQPIHDLRRLPVDTPLDDADRRQILAATWILASPDQYYAARPLLTTLARRFLARGHLNAAYQLLEKLPAAILDNAADADEETRVAMGEITGYSLLCHFLATYKQWQTLRQQHLQSTLRDTRLERRLVDLVDQLDKAGHKLLLADWLVIDDHSSELVMPDAKQAQLRAEMRLLRQIYIPEITLKLHEVLYESDAIYTGGLQKSLELAGIIACEGNNLHDDFVRSRRMPELVYQLHRTVVAMQPSEST